MKSDLPTNYLKFGESPYNNLLKSRKEPANPKNFQLVSLVCPLYKAFELMVHNCIVEHISEKVIKEHIDFRKRSSCTGQ